MSHLLKRTKKSCLKLLRKISASKQLFAQKLEEDEDTSTNSNHSPAHSNNSHAVQKHTPKHTVHYTASDSDAESQQLSYDENQNNAIANGLTSKFFLGADGYEFKRLQPLRSDAASEVLEFEPEFLNGVNFEKMQLKDNVRYLRHTPSSSSVDVHSTTETASISANRNLFSELHSNQRSNDSQQKLTCDHSSDAQLLVPDEQQNTNMLRNRNANKSNALKWDMDINGNSLDENATLVMDNHWHEFECKWNKLQDKRLMQLAHADSSLKSSHQSSVCTLETWLDEENQENSALNENLSQKCNLCLKSL